MGRRGPEALLVGPIAPLRTSSVAPACVPENFMARLSSSAARYTVALLATGLASLLHVWSGPLEVDSDVHYFGFVLAVLVTALFGGMGPGLLATGLSVLVSAYLLLPPLYSLQISSHDQLIRLILFGGEGLLLSCVGHIFRDADVGDNGSWASRYLPVVLFVATASGLKLLAYKDVERELPFTFFYVAIAASAWTGGIVPGLLATFLSALVSAWLFLGPQSSMPLRAPINEARIALFVVEGTLIAGLSTTYPRARRMAKRAVAEMHQYSDRMHRTLEDMRALRLTSQDLIWELDPNSNRMTFGATKAERPETPVASMSFSSWLDEIHPEDRASVAKSLDRVLSQDRDDWKCEYRKLHVGGEPIYISDRAYVIRDGEGKAKRVVGRSTDVSEAKRRGAPAGVSRRYQAVFEQSPVAILVTDEALNITSANRAAADLLGSAGSEIKATHIDELFPERRRKVILDLLRELNRDQRPRTFRELCTPSLGEPFEAKINAAALGDVDNGLKGCVITIEKFDE